MSLQQDVMEAMKVAMKEKNQEALAALRAVKSEILLAQTETGSKEEISEDQEMKILSKLVKQRKDSAAIYTEQNRNDLAEPELIQAEIISRFLPAQLSEAEIEKVVVETIDSTGAEGMKDMGKVMSAVMPKVKGKADGSLINKIVQEHLQ